MRSGERWCIVMKKAGKTKVISGEGYTREKAVLLCSCHVYTTPHKYIPLRVNLGVV